MFSQSKWSVQTLELGEIMSKLILFLIIGTLIACGDSGTSTPANEIDEPSSPVITQKDMCNKLESHSTEEILNGLNKLIKKHSWEINDLIENENQFVTSAFIFGQLVQIDQKLTESILNSKNFIYYFRLIIRNSESTHYINENDLITCKI